MLTMIDNTVQYGEDLDVKTSDFDNPERDDEGQLPDDWWAVNTCHNKSFPPNIVPKVPTVQGLLKQQKKFAIFGNFLQLLANFYFCYFKTVYFMYEVPVGTLDTKYFKDSFAHR